MSSDKNVESDTPARINVTFTKAQIDLIDAGVKAGMAFNRAEYIRKAVDKLNEEIPTFQVIQDKIKNEEQDENILKNK